MKLKNNKNAWKKRNPNTSIAVHTATSTNVSESNSGGVFVIRVLGTLHVVFGLFAVYNHSLFIAYLLIQSGILIHIVAGNWEAIKNV